jgi:hypothetical protein
VRPDFFGGSRARQHDRAVSPVTQKNKLISAMIQLNLVGVQSANEMVERPELQSLSPVRIKDKIAGMTADEIVDLANRTSTVKIKVKSER